MADMTDTWNEGKLAHLIPTASHERFLIKASFKAPLAGKPRLTVDGKPIEGKRTDSRGPFLVVRCIIAPAGHSVRVADH